MVEILTKTNEIALGLNGALIFSKSIEFEYWKTSEVDNVMRGDYCQNESIQLCNSVGPFYHFTVLL